MNKKEILNKYIDLIDKGYCSDCNELNCIDNFPYAKITHAIRELQQENQELKKQLEERILDSSYYDMITDENISNKNQQKEFIEWLEDLIKQNETVIEVSKYGLPKNCSKLLIDFYKEILQKYKEIIGDDK